MWLRATSGVLASSVGQQLLDPWVHWLYEYWGSTGLCLGHYWIKENEHMHVSLWIHDVHMECLHSYAIWYMFYMECSHVILIVMCWFSSLSYELIPPQCCYPFWDTVTENYLQMDRLIPQVPSSSLSCITYGFRIEFKAVVESNVFTLIFERLPEWIVICIID